MLLAFDDVGPGPVVVLLHGFPLDRTMWSHQRSSVGATYRVILPDLRGHGTSAAPDEGYEVDTMADDVLELLDALQIDGPVVLGGLSMGGYVTLSIAARYPERLSALMLLDTRASADSAEVAQSRRQRAAQIEATGNTNAVVDAMLPNLFARQTFERQPGVVAATRARMAMTPARAVAGTLRGLASRPDRTAELGRIVVPTLVLTGAEDAIVPIEETRAMAEAIPKARLVVIPDAGHLAPLENHQAVDSAILGFLESLW
jgi:pimeloyl-ACP methyl ester carboxylesterase